MSEFPAAPRRAGAGPAVSFRVGFNFVTAGRWAPGPFQRHAGEHRRDRTVRSSRRVRGRHSMLIFPRTRRGSAGAPRSGAAAGLLRDRTVTE
eukprot:553176-Hanusia_phi.AAC.1